MVSWILSKESTQVKILNKTIFISENSNTRGGDMQRTSLPLAMGEY